MVQTSNKYVQGKKINKFNLPSICLNNWTTNFISQKDKLQHEFSSWGFIYPFNYTMNIQTKYKENEKLDKIHFFYNRENPEDQLAHGSKSDAYWAHPSPLKNLVFSSYLNSNSWGAPHWQFDTSRDVLLTTEQKPGSRWNTKYNATII